MKKIIKSGIYLLSMMGVFLMITISCKKNDDSSNPDSTSNIVKDIDGNVYHTITIGTQEWMVENLKTSKYRNGNLIGTTSPSTLDISGATEPKYQWAYDANESNVASYGRLYTWYAITDIRGICPIGWHIPSDDEWDILVNYLGGSSVAGGKLKVTDTIYWKANGPFGIHPNQGTNESGFTALASGCRWATGTFFYKGYYTYWWSSTEDSPERAYHRSLGYEDDGVGRYNDPKNTGNSVRCIKD
jgi:uncharacterized protein (TIGR02145 family)